MRHPVRQVIAGSLAGLLSVTLLGCYVPTWRHQTPRSAQCVEDRWGDVVDTVGNLSTVNQPWHDPHYVKTGVYRVAADGIPYTSYSGDVHSYPTPATEAPPPVPVDQPVGDLKPPLYLGQ